MDLNFKEIGERIQGERKVQGFKTVGQFAGSKGFSPGSMFNLENGKNVSEQKLSEICTYLRVRYEWACTGTGKLRLEAGELNPSFGVPRAPRLGATKIADDKPVPNHMLPGIDSMLGCAKELDKLIPEIQSCRDKLVELQRRQQVYKDKLQSFLNSR